MVCVCVLDIDECQQKTDDCFSGQLCMNIWTSYYCAGPFDDNTVSVGGENLMLFPVISTQVIHHFQLSLFLFTWGQ